MYTTKITFSIAALSTRVVTQLFYRGKLMS